MESFMDEVKVESAIGLGTKVTMRKKIGGNIDGKYRTTRWPNY